LDIRIMKPTLLVPFIVLLVLGANYCQGAQPATVSFRETVIQSPTEGALMEKLAAREVRRYLYLHTGRLLPVVTESPSGRRDEIVVARNDRLAVKEMARRGGFAAELDRLKPQQYLLRTLSDAKRQCLVVTGGDELGTLYGAYRLAEILGFRFYLQDDLIPEAATAFYPRLAARPQKTVASSRGLLIGATVLPFLNEQGQPLFPLRGIQPFHDFPEGPDWWNQDDYVAILSQLPKLRMNFFGLHTYPEGGPNAEPAVWIGPAGDISTNSQVAFSYPSSWHNTQRGNWGYRSKKTSAYSFGAAQLFERDDYGGEAMFNLCPQPATPDTANELFRRTGILFRDAFTHAHWLGIKTCVGTEIPLVIPQALKDRLKAQGQDPTNAAVIQALYEGMFQRIMQTHPLDYYWFWTPETWTWEGTKAEQIQATTNDLFLAINAAKKVNASFKLATCGWVLGPPNNRALFNQILPPDIAVSCINREVGNTPVEPGFRQVSGRSKWAIPWLEDDPALTAPQLWAGRMRQDAVDALQYGCDGLMGIHWRTRNLEPSVAALAAAAWEQKSWLTRENQISGWIGGQKATFAEAKIEDTTEPEVYRTVRYGMSTCRLLVPNGAYSITLKFCEPHFKEKGKRVFSVKIQGNIVVDRLDIFEKAGTNRALDLSFDNLAVTQGRLDLEFVQHVENPSLAGLIVKGANYSLKVNCGGPAVADYVADLPELPRHQPVHDFYQDWALHQFGSAVAASAAAIFERIDGRLPRPADWVEGPGGLKADDRSWPVASKDYAFVDELAALQAQVQGPGYRDRFDYWLSNFKYMRAMAQMGCLSAQLNKHREALKKEKDPAQQQSIARQNALPILQQMVPVLQSVYEHLLATISTPGELGTLMNWEQHILPKVFLEPRDELAKTLKDPLPGNAFLPTSYSGPTRLIVPTKRAAVYAGEPLRIKTLAISEQPLKSAALYWRPLGKGAFRRITLGHVSRGVYLASLPPADDRDLAIEYFLKATPAKGPPVYYPATAPKLNQTVVIMPVRVAW
jgi:hypothetical protein